MNTKTIFTICLLLLGTMALQAQEQELKRFRDDNGKWGYKDQNGKVIIAPKYDLVYDFSDGMAVVRSSETRLYGYINKTGKEVLSPKYLDAKAFSDGVASVFVLETGQWIYIDKTGKQIENKSKTQHKSH